MKSIKELKDQLNAFKSKLQQISNPKMDKVVNKEEIDKLKGQIEEIKLTIKNK